MIKNATNAVLMLAGKMKSTLAIHVSDVPYVKVDMDHTIGENSPQKQNIMAMFAGEKIVSNSNSIYSHWL